MEFTGYKSSVAKVSCDCCGHSCMSVHSSEQGKFCSVFCQRMGPTKSIPIVDLPIEYLMGGRHALSAHIQ